MNRVHDDAAIIMETIVNELSYAESYADSTGMPTSIQLIGLVDDAEDPDYDGYYQTVKYSDKGGNSAVMRITTETDTEAVALVGEGKLLIAYEKVEEEKENGTVDLIRKEIDWSYGKGLYRDNKIRLGFKKKAGENIITVRLTVTNTTSQYSYTQETDVRCINVTQDKIQEETVGP